MQDINDFFGIPKERTAQLLNDVKDVFYQPSEKVGGLELLEYIDAYDATDREKQYMFLIAGYMGGKV
jgi:hypothetical protein